MFRPGLIIGFFGSLGSGKTLTMTAFTDAASRSLGVGAVANYDTDVASRLENLAQLVNSLTSVSADTKAIRATVTDILMRPLRLAPFDDPRGDK